MSRSLLGSGMLLGAALYLCKLLKEAGYPPGAVQVLNGYRKETGYALTTHLDIDKIAFTGSTTTGQAVIKVVTVNMKNTTVQAGDESAFHVFDDADVKQAAKRAFAGGIGNSGQICSANSHILIQESMHESTSVSSPSWQRTPRSACHLTTAQPKGHRRQECSTTRCCNTCLVSFNAVYN